MEKLPEFMANHPLLFAALAAVIVFIAINEFRRKAGSAALTAKEAVRLINDRDALILDVREPGEYKSGHIINAKNIPQNKLAEEAGRLKSDKATPVIVYCKSGTRSQAACDVLKNQGFESVFYLKNGLYSWTEDNLPTSK